MVGGHEAVQLRVAEKYIEQFGNLAKSTNTMIVPSNVGDVAGFLATAMSIVVKNKGDVFLIAVTLTTLFVGFFTYTNALS